MNKRSVIAVVVGVVAIIVVTTIVDIVLHAVNVFPQSDKPGETLALDDGLAALATFYRFVISVGGAWLTARLAPSNPMKHAMALGYVGVVLGIIGAIATWNAGLGPHWYPVALVILALPQCWLGGWLYERRTRNTI